MLLLIESNRFCKYRANSRKKLFITIVLQLLSICCFIARNNSKQLKLITLTTILEEICL